VACDIFHAEGNAKPAYAGVDCITQPTAYRRKQLLIADMDSTLIMQECIDELADYLGIKPQIAAITERAMNGELQFEDALRERVALLKGLPESALAEVYSKQITLMPGGKTLAATMKANGAYLVIVSGGFTYFTGRVREALGFDEDRSNRLEVAEGALTGRIIPPILGADAKLESLKEIASARSIPTEAILALGDGANDVPMLKAAGLGVACHAKPFVQSQVSAQLNHNGLSALLYIQGYRRDAWVN